MFNEFTPDEFYSRIGITKEMESVLDSLSLSEVKYREYRALFDTDLSEFYEYIKQQERHRIIFLKLYLRFAYDAYEEYRDKGIAIKIYIDTFKDIVCWVENCRRDYGETGLNEYDWLWRHIKLKLFRLGRLQFEIVDGNEEPSLNDRSIGKGQISLNLHIPQGEPLIYEECLESIKMAREFFGEYKEISCHSWLLSPALKEILPPASNIIRFQNLFRIYALDADSREAEERVFHKLYEEPAKYPEETSLQREMKNYLMTGKKPGSAFGVVVIE